MAESKKQIIVLKKILILLKTSIVNQGRMINFINTLSAENEITLYYLAEKNQNIQLGFNSNVELCSYEIKKNFFNKIIKHTFYWLEYYDLKNIVLRDKKEEKFDIIICHDLPVLLPSIKLSKHYHSKLIYDSLEIYNETINQFFPSVRGVKKIIAKLLVKFMRFNGTITEHILSKKVDAMITVNQSLASFFEEKYHLQKVHVVMNCPVLSVGKPIPKINFRDFLNLRKEDVIFLYQGVLNEGRGLELLLEAFYRINNTHSNIKLVVIGNGVLEPQLHNFVKKNNLQNSVHFMGSVAYKELVHYTTSADFGINLLETFNLSKKYASPNKLFEYMQAEIPVLCSYSPENDLVFKKHNIGVQCANDVNCISDAIIKLAESDIAQLNIYTENLKKAKLEYNWENQSKKLESIINSI